MMAYEKNLRRLVGASMIAGSVLSTLAAFIFIFDIQKNPGLMGWGSNLEGVIGVYSYLLLAVAFVELSRRFAHARPQLATVTTVTAVIGFGVGGVVNMALRTFIPDLVTVGVTIEQLNAITELWMTGTANPALLLVIFTGPLGPLTSILVGIGFLLGGVSKVRGSLLIAAGILFPMGELFLVGFALYVTATVLWVLVLVPMGLDLLRDSASAGLAERVTAM